jgi:hypothetical protein
VKTIVILAVLCGMVATASAQQIEGKVVDAATNAPLQGVSVLLRTNENKIAGYTFSDAKGTYRITAKAPGDSLYLEFSLLGYAKQQRKITAKQTAYDVALEVEAVNLREVVVRPSKIWNQRDTINYSVSAFQSEHDRVIGDVLKRLPGINVSESGAISYNGTPINKFYIEGMDALGGKYGLATRNVPADAVSKVQVLENHQPIKALAQNTFSDQAAINLVLKDGARSRWLSKADAGFGAAPFLWNDRLTLMRISRSQQNINLYKTNNTGLNVTDELRFHAVNSLMTSFENTTGESDWLSVIAPATPGLSENRTLFNHSHLLSSNHLWRTGNDYQLRANLNYLYDEQCRHTETKTVYYLPADSALVISESQDSKRYNNQLEANVALTSNADNHYLMNNLIVREQWTDTRAGVLNEAGNVTQKLQTPQHFLSNDFQWMKNTGRFNVQFTSFNSYSSLPQELQITPGIYESIFNDGNTFDALCQTVHFTSFFSNNYVALKASRNNWRMELRAGFQLKSQRVNSELFPVVNAIPANAVDTFANHFGVTHYHYSLQPRLAYQGRQLKASLTLPASYNIINGTPRWLAQPQLSLIYEWNARWKASAYSSWSNTLGDIRSMTPHYILTNYRSMEKNSSDLQEESRLSSHRLIFSYRNTVTAFFANLSAAYYAGNRMLYDYSFSGILSRREPIGRYAPFSRWEISGEASRLIDAWNTTFWLGVNYNRAEAEQVRQHVRTRYANASVSLLPKIAARIAHRINVEYKATFTRSQMRIYDLQTETSAPVFSMSHFLTGYVTFSKKWKGYVQCDYFYTHRQGMSYPAVFFTDAGIQYVLKNVEFALDCKNIFNTGSYQYAAVSSLNELYNTFELRPVSVLLKVSFSLS